MIYCLILFDSFWKFQTPVVGFCVVDDFIKHFVILFIGGEDDIPISILNNSSSHVRVSRSAALWKSWISIFE